MKLMALDYGSKRVGVASTDESGQFALPRMILINDEHLLESVLEFKNKEGIEKIIIGESKDYKGNDNAVMKDALLLKTSLENRGAEVILHPEVLTTMEARQLQGQTEMTDASAAAIILKSYIDNQKVN